MLRAHGPTAGRTATQLGAGCGPVAGSPSLIRGLFCADCAAMHWLFPRVGLDHLFNLGFDGIEVERSRCLHRRILDGRLCQLEDPLLHVDEALQLTAHEIVEVTGTLIVHRLTLYRRCPLERVLADIDWRRHVRRVLLARPTIGLLDKHELEIVEPDCAKLGPPK